MTSFLNAQLNYCPLIWMLHSRSNNSKIKHFHERCLRLIYKDKQSSYEELLIKDSTVSIHHKNIQTLAAEMFNVKNEMSPKIICDIFTKSINNHCNLRHINLFKHLLQHPFTKKWRMSHILDLRFGTLSQKNKDTE